MFDNILKLCNGKYDIIAICVYDKEVYAVPCEDTMSGIYPDYKQKIKLSNDLVSQFIFDNATHYAILLTNRNGTLEFYLAENTWDGYQIVDKDTISD